jgi:hypothetical protein
MVPPMATEFDPDEVVRQVTESLVRKFPEKDEASVEGLVRAQVDSLKDRPIQDYISVLAERAVKKQLKHS